MSLILVAVADNNDRGAVSHMLHTLANERGLPRGSVQRHKEGYLVPEELFDGQSVPLEVHKPVKASSVSPLDPALHDVGPDNVTTTAPLAEGVSVPPDREAVRAWAVDNGIEVAEKGQLKRAVYEAYAAAHEEN